MQRQVLFKCPRTGINVQHELDDVSPESPAAEDTHVAVRCPACTSLHFVNSATGKLLGDPYGQPGQVRDVG